MGACRANKRYLGGQGVTRARSWTIEGMVSRTRRRRGAVRQNKEFLSFLVRHKNNKKKFRTILQGADEDEINSITEILYNFLKGNLKCHNPQKYKSHANTLRFIADPTKSYKVRKRRAVSQGSGLPLVPLLTTVIPLVLQMLNSKKTK